MVPEWFHRAVYTVPRRSRVAQHLRLPPDSSRVPKLRYNGGFLDRPRPLGVQDSYFYNGQGWNHFTMSPAGSVVNPSQLAAVTRAPNTMELWWIGTASQVHGAFWFQGGTWAQYTLPGTFLYDNLAAVAPSANQMELFFDGGFDDLTRPSRAAMGNTVGPSSQQLSAQPVPRHRCGLVDQRYYRGFRRNSGRGHCGILQLTRIPKGRSDFARRPALLFMLQNGARAEPKRPPPRSVRIRPRSSARGRATGG